MKRAVNFSCLLCYQASPTPVCQWCENDLFIFTCPQYKENLLEFGLISRHVRHSAFHKLCLLGLYTHPLSTLIQAMKFRHSLASASEIARLFVTKMQQHHDPLPTLLLPVPISPFRMARRHYNQAAILASHISTHTGIPFCNSWAQRKGASTQHTLSKQARVQNARRAFSLTTPCIDRFLKTPGMRLHVAIVDDVITTGVSADVLAALLSKRYPALYIEVWAMAFTPPPKSTLLNY